jgi:hypothetical protein
MSKLSGYDACAGYQPNSGTSQAAEDGTRLHEIMDTVIERVKANGTSAMSALDDYRAGTPVIESDEELYYLQYCCTELDRFLPHAITIYNEIAVQIINPDGSELNHGHLDVLLDLGGGRGVLVDYKFGWIPVPPAQKNLQGMGYAAGSFQKFPALNTVGVLFIQPKLNKVTTGKFTRDDLPDMYQRIRGVIESAQSPSKTLRPNVYCDFCEARGTCTALLKNAHAAVTRYEGLPFPDIFDGASITTPEQALAALYVIDRLESLIQTGGVRAKALELAKAAGGHLEAQVSDDKKIVVEVRQRKMPRSVNSPALIADALKDVLTPEQVLGCCEPAVGALEEAFANAYVEKTTEEAEAILVAGYDAAEATTDRAAAKAILADAKARAKETKSTKKNAMEIMASVLLSEGLMTAPSGTVDYLKLKVESTDAKQITA